MLGLFKKKTYLRVNARLDNRSIFVSIFPRLDDNTFDMDNGLTMKLDITEAAQLALGIKKGRKVEFIHDTSLAGGDGNSILSFGKYKDVYFMTIRRKVGKKASKMAFPLDAHELFLLYLYLEDAIRNIMRDRLPPASGELNELGEQSDEENGGEVEIEEESLEEEEYKDEPPFPDDLI